MSLLGPLLETGSIDFFLTLYAGSSDPAALTDPWLSPIRYPSHEGLPPAIVVTAGFDPLIDEGVAYAEALRAAGVAVEWQNAEQLRFVLREGRKRQIRRMCEQVGLAVTGLKRIRIGGVLLGDLPVGQWRYLGAGERF